MLDASLTADSQSTTAANTKPCKRLELYCRNVERGEIARALVEEGHNRTHTARALGISRRTLLNKIKQHGLTRGVCRQLAGDMLPQPAVVQN
jgi:DNA-binding NtrC family response regulator